MEIITNEKTGIVLYANLLSDIKTRIRRAQVKATLSANAEMIKMYLDIGRMIHKRQQQEGWSAAIIPHLSRDLRNELPEVKGFSERNLGRMLAFFRNYQNIESFLPQHVAKSGSSDFSLRPDAKLPLGDLILSIPWGHHIFDFLTLAEPFNEREVKKLGAVCNKYLNCGTASTQKTEYLSGNIHWVSGADVWE